MVYYLIKQSSTIMYWWMIYDSNSCEIDIFASTNISSHFATLSPRRFGERLVHKDHITVISWYIFIYEYNLEVCDAIALLICGETSLEGSDHDDVLATNIFRVAGPPRYFQWILSKTEQWWEVLWLLFFQSERAFRQIIEPFVNRLLVGQMYVPRVGTWSVFALRRRRQ